MRKKNDGSPDGSRVEVERITSRRVSHQICKSRSARNNVRYRDNVASCFAHGNFLMRSKGQVDAPAHRSNPVTIGRSFPSFTPHHHRSQSVSQSVDEEINKVSSEHSREKVSARERGLRFYSNVSGSSGHTLIEISRRAFPALCLPHAKCAAFGNIICI